VENLLFLDSVVEFALFFLSVGVVGVAVGRVHGRFGVRNCGGVAGVGAADSAVRLLSMRVRVAVARFVGQAPALERLLLGSPRRRLPALRGGSVSRDVLRPSSNLVDVCVCCGGSD
jgi:hypothetical protein